MAAKVPKLTIKSRIWIEDEQGKVVFGAGRLRILDAVEKYGSMLGAAKALGMSYRALWAKIRLTEDRLGQSVLEKHAGGAKSGSKLTPFGRTLIERYRQTENLTRSTVDVLFSGIFAVTMTEEEQNH
ncbi:MAG TPA: LysR family transcriptional regulator [Syntrophobacteraceae bacterium]|nr:LysR family transcriptional regulator [Syntrophobacteraceae bacterium]